MTKYKMRLNGFKSKIFKNEIVEIWHKAENGVLTVSNGRTVDYVMKFDLEKIEVNYEK